MNSYQLAVHPVVVLLHHVAAVCLIFNHLYPVYVIVELIHILPPQSVQQTPFTHVLSNTYF